MRVVPGLDGKARAWDLTDRAGLVARTLYRKGAHEVLRRLTQARGERAALLRLVRAVEALPMELASYTADPVAWDRLFCQVASARRLTGHI
jgi:hypothetical protein